MIGAALEKGERKTIVAFMSLYFVLPVAMATTCLTVAFYELLAWSRLRGHRSDIAFALTCFAAAVYDLACAGEYTVSAPAESVPWLRAQAIFLNVIAMCFLWYLSSKTERVPRGLFISFMAWFGASIAAQAAGLGDLTWIVGKPLVRRVALPFGLEVVYREVESGIVTIIQTYAGMALFVYLFWVVWRYARDGYRREARSLFWLLGIICASFAHGFAIDLGLVNSPYSLEYAWLAAVAFVGIQRSHEAVEAAAAKQALAESERRYRAIFESLQDVYFRTDAEGIVRLISPSVRTFGYEPQAILGKPVAFFFDETAARETMGRELASSGAVSDYELRVRGPDSRLFDVSLNAHAVFDERGEKNGVEGIMRDVSDRKRAEEKVLASLAEKSVLLKEIHHRVKNNLQIVSSLLYLKEVRVSDPGFKAIVRDCRNQVFSMALIHDDLYRSHDLRSIDFGTYLRNLVTRLLAAYGAGGISYVPVVENINLGIDQAIPCGLIVNELCTNSLKHAFPAERQKLDPEIRVELSRTAPGRIRLVVADNGVGLPPGMEFPSESSLGTQIVARLVKQLHGEIRVDGACGTRCAIEFPES
jgi:PAS domain S-box-containing protein